MIRPGPDEYLRAALIETCPACADSVFALVQKAADNKLILPSIIYTPSGQLAVDSFGGSKRVAQGFAVEFRALTYEEAVNLERAAMDRFSDDVRVRGSPTSEIAESHGAALAGTQSIAARAIFLYVKF